MGGAVTVNKSDVRVRKSIVTDGVPEPEIRLAIESGHECPVAIRIHDGVPKGFSVSDVEFHSEDGSENWQASETGVEFSRVILSYDSLVATYSIDCSEGDVEQLSNPPAIEAVSPVDPEDIGMENEDEAPLWRGKRVTAQANDRDGTEVDGGRRLAQDGATPLLLSRDSEVTPTLSVVMPTLDEEQGIAECIERIERAVETLGISAEVIVSDSSTDRTPEIARESGAIVVEPDEEGYGYAYRYAFERARGEYIAIGDADTTYDFLDLPRLLNPVGFGPADMAMGDRLQGSIEPGAMPRLHQYVGNPLLTKFLNAFYGAGVGDAHSGFRVISQDALDQLELTSDGMEFASEMIMKAGAEGLLIEEVPITYHEREGEATLSSFRDGWRHIRFMLTNAPGWLFSMPGSVSGALGTLVMVLSFFDIAPGGIAFGIHSMIAGGLLTIIGYQALSLGAFAIVAGDPISRPNDRITTWIVDRMSLKSGAAVGLSVFMTGTAYATYLLAQWISSGFTDLPLIKADIIAFTAIVLGIQTVLYSFFIETVGDRR